MQSSLAPRKKITFTVPHQPIFDHRGPEEWLDDIWRFTSIPSVDATWVAHHHYGAWSIEVEGTEEAMRFVCVALNLHAEQSPWDTTPADQAQALEDLWKS